MVRFLSLRVEGLKDLAAFCALLRRASILH
jgi:hypothetical protein